MILGYLARLHEQPYLCSISLDSCINSAYNVPGSSGADPVIPSNFIPMLDFSKPRNSMYFGYWW